MTWYLVCLIPLKPPWAYHYDSPLSLLSGVSGESLVENTNRELFDSLSIYWSHKCPLSTSTRSISGQRVYRQDQKSIPGPSINK